MAGSGFGAAFGAGDGSGPNGLSWLPVLRPASPAKGVVQGRVVRLANHGVATDSAEIVGDLACGRAFVPHLFQALDALFRPGHLQNCSNSLRPTLSTDSRRGAVNDHPIDDPAVRWLRFAPGKPVLRGVNWEGLKTLYIKEVRRFFKVQLQTVWAPAVTTLLYLAIFTVALGRGGRTVLGVPFANFIAPGLIVMAMI